GRLRAASPGQWVRWSRRCSGSGTSDTAAPRSGAGIAPAADRPRTHRLKKRLQRPGATAATGLFPASVTCSCAPLLVVIAIFAHDRLQDLDPDFFVHHTHMAVADDPFGIHDVGFRRAINAQIQAETALR